VSDEHYCPRCNAPFLSFHGVNTRHFKCGSSTQIPSVACGYASQLQDRITQLETDNDSMRADLLLWGDNLRLQQRINRLEEENDALRADLLLWENGGPLP